MLWGKSLIARAFISEFEPSPNRHLKTKQIIIIKFNIRLSM